MNEDIYDDNNSIDISHTDIILRPGSASSNRIRSVRFKQSIPNKLELRYDDESLELNNTQGRLNTFRKVCFGFGGLPYQLCANSIALYFAIFLLDVAKIRPGQVSAILFSARGWDAITDPLIGFLVNRTNSRFGKLRPWILFSTPFAILSYIMIWYVPPDFDRSLKTFWYLLFYCLFQTFLSCRHVPYTSLTMYLTPVQAERDSATSFRMGFEVLGVLLAAVIQGVMITIVNPTNNCDKSTLAAMKFTTSGSNYSTSPNIFYDEIDTTTKKHGSNNALADGYLITAGITGFIYLVSSFVVFFGTKEMNDVIVDKDLKFFSSLKAVFRHKSYITLLVTFLLNSLAVQLVQANLALFCKYSIDAGDQYQFIIIFLLLSGIISLPIWQILIPKYGKKSIYAFGLMLFIPLLFFLLYIEEPIWLMYVSSLIGGLSIAVNFLLPWSMLPDVIDEFMIKTGERKESIFYSFYVFFTKLSAGLAVSASALVLEFAGYEDCLDGCCKQPESVGLTLRLLIVPAPVIMILGSLMFLWKHPIDEARRIEIKETLAILRNSNRS